MNCPLCGKFAWKVDRTRKHGRPGRVFVVCSCGKGRAQMSASGKVFVTTSPRQYVRVLVLITPEQKVWLSKRDNQSAEIRAALDAWMAR